MLQFGWGTSENLGGSKAVSNQNIQRALAFGPVPLKSDPVPPFSLAINIYPFAAYTYLKDDIRIWNGWATTTNWEYMLHYKKWDMLAFLPIEESQV